MNGTKVTLQLLQEKFVAGLGRRIDQLNGCLVALREEQEHTAALDDMMRGFHSLAGIGGTYGYLSITNVAREGETFCRSVADQVSASDVDTLAGVVDALTVAASAAASQYRDHQER